MLNFPYQSLHGHTTASDGVLTHEQVLDECAKNKIGLFAFTDHDQTPKIEILKKLKQLNHEVKFIPGIEISCDFVKEVPGKLSTFHVTGLFIDPTNKELKDFCVSALASRRERLKGFVTGLQKIGFAITEAEVLSVTKGEAIGRPHMVLAMKQHPENLVLLEKFYKELIELAKKNEVRSKQLKDLEKLTDDFKENKKWYTLVLSPDALHSVYLDYHEENITSMDDAVKLIRSAGGLAMIAHWSYLRDRLTIDLINKILQEKRLDGMETVYSFGIEDGRDIFVQDMLDLAKLCDKYHLIQGGGGDFHQPEDFALMIDPKFSDFAERTEGMVERMLKLHPNLNRDWSTI